MCLLYFTGWFWCQWRGEYMVGYRLQLALTSHLQAHCYRNSVVIITLWLDNQSTCWSMHTQKHHLIQIQTCLWLDHTVIEGILAFGLNWCRTVSCTDTLKRCLWLDYFNATCIQGHLWLDYNHAEEEHLWLVFSDATWIQEHLWLDYNHAEERHLWLVYSDVTWIQEHLWLDYNHAEEGHFLLIYSYVTWIQGWLWLD